MGATDGGTVVRTYAIDSSPFPLRQRRIELRLGPGEIVVFTSWAEHLFIQQHPLRVLLGGEFARGDAGTVQAAVKGLRIFALPSVDFVCQATSQCGVSW
jgi:hypothetical protein